jgi:hypothetical protein
MRAIRALYVSGYFLCDFRFQTLYLYDMVRSASPASSSTWRKRVGEIVDGWNDEHYDNPLDAAQEAIELLEELPKQFSVEAEQLRQIVAFVKSLDSKPSAKEKRTKSVSAAKETARENLGHALMDALVAGEDLTSVLARGATLPAVKRDWFVSQVDTILHAVMTDEMTWAKKQLRAWPRDVPFTKEHLAQWKPKEIRAAMIANSAAIFSLLAKLGPNSFQPREETVEALIELVVQHNATAQIMSAECKRALDLWSNRSSLGRISDWVEEKSERAPAASKPEWESLHQFWEKMS